LRERSARASLRFFHATGSCWGSTPQAGCRMPLRVTQQPAWVNYAFDSPQTSLLHVKSSVTQQEPVRQETNESEAKRTESLGEICVGLHCREPRDPPRMGASQIRNLWRNWIGIRTSRSISRHCGSCRCGSLLSVHCLWIASVPSILSSATFTVVEMAFRNSDWGDDRGVVPTCFARVTLQSSDWSRSIRDSSRGCVLRRHHCNRVPAQPTKCRTRQRTQPATR